MAPGKKILLVEDDPVGRAGLAVVLGHLGHLVRCAASGAEAIQELRTHRPDLILLDLDTAEHDGGEFYRRHDQDPALADVPLVVVSRPGRRRREDDVKSEITRLQKPINLEELLAALGRLPPRE